MPTMQPRCFLASTLLVATTYVTAQEYGVDIPAEPIPGVSFPTAETTINDWIFKPDPDVFEVYRHGWGIWSGLTMQTDTTAFGIKNARIYQTWLSPKGILDRMNGKSDKPFHRLRSPLQHLRGSAGPELLAMTPTAVSGLKIDYSIAEIVAYSPASARHTYSNKLLWTNTLNSLVENGYTQIPPFPANAVNIKPVYKLISKEELNYGKLYAMPAWPGTPDTSNWNADRKAKGFPNTDWNQCTYVDVTNDGTTAARGVDTTCKNPTSDNTYGLDDFIYINIDAETLEHFKSLTKGQLVNLTIGDILILVGMHVTTRETTRWTWQTFWWAADPNAPNSPSSEAIAKYRPETMQGAVAHYAMSVAYSMLSPAQPLVGGHNIGSLVPAYNPHLEAGFGTSTFGKTLAVQTPNGSVTTDLGVQSNCISCHGMAGYATKNSTYVSNFYVPLDAVSSDGMTLDFAWSIVDEAEPKPNHEK